MLTLVIYMAEGATQNVRRKIPLIPLAIHCTVIAKTHSGNLGFNHENIFYNNVPCLVC